MSDQLTDKNGTPVIPYRSILKIDGSPIPRYVVEDQIGSDGLIRASKLVAYAYSRNNRRIDLNKAEVIGEQE